MSRAFIAPGRNARASSFVSLSIPYYAGGSSLDVDGQPAPDSIEDLVRGYRDRFMMLEIYEKRFARRLRREQWLKVMEASLGMKEFRRVMFSRLMPNLRSIGVVGPRMQARYAATRTPRLRRRPSRGPAADELSSS